MTLVTPGVLRPGPGFFLRGPVYNAIGVWICFLFGRTDEIQKYYRRSGGRLATRTVCTDIRGVGDALPLLHYPVDGNVTGGKQKGPCGRQLVGAKDAERHNGYLPWCRGRLKTSHFYTDERVIHVYRFRGVSSRNGHWPESRSLSFTPTGSYP